MEEKNENCRQVVKTLKRVEQRLIELEHAQRMALTTMNNIQRVQKRNFDKMMDGFRRIQEAFYMSGRASVDVHEELCEHLGTCD